MFVPPKVESPVPPCATARSVVNVSEESAEAPAVRVPETVWFPETSEFPVVVAPPEMVRPVAWAPAPIVEDAFEIMPPVKETSEEVALARNGYAKLA